MIDPCAACARTNKCRSDASYKKCPEYQFYRKENSGVINLDVNPCDECTTSCHGKHFKDCSIYRSWIKARLERARRNIVGKPPRSKSSYLVWMERRCRWGMDNG